MAYQPAEPNLEFYTALEELNVAQIGALIGVYKITIGALQEGRVPSIIQALLECNDPNGLRTIADGFTKATE